MSTPTRAGIGLRWALAVASLELVWLCACERWRESSPLALALFLGVPWTMLALAWRAVLPSGRRATVALGAALIATSVVLEIASPYPPRFAIPGWELARAVCLALASLLAARPAVAQPRRAIASLLAGARAASAALAVLVPATMIYIAVHGARDEAERADAAVVLGFALDPSGRARPQLVGRVERAVRLLDDGLVPRLVVSGGVATAGHTEASVMRELALDMGAPSEAIVLEEAARSTIENFACSKALLASLGAGRVLVVTEPWHMTRSMLLARRHGLDARAAPASSAIWRSPRHAVYWVFRDAIAFAFERARDPWASPGVCEARECEGCREF